MKTLSISELIKDAPTFVSLLKHGEEVELTESGRRLAKVVPHRVHRTEPRPIGLAKGEFVVPKDFNAPLPEEVLREFEAE